MTMLVLPLAVLFSTCGAVGTFTMAGRVAPEAAAQGEAVQLALTLRGTGNAAALAAPEIPAPEGVDVYFDKSAARSSNRRSTS